jgi:hypothetical protein
MGKASRQKLRGDKDGRRAKRVAGRQASAARPGGASRPREASFGTRLGVGGSARATDSEGWYSGRAAADLASLHNRVQVGQPG